MRRSGESSPSSSSKQSVLPPSFRSSIISEYSIQIKIAIIAISTILVYFKDIYLTGSEGLSSNYYNYVVLVPLLSGYLIYRKRRMLSAVLSIKDETYFNVNLAAGFGALIICIVLYMYGAVTASPEDYRLISLEIFLGAAVLLLFNRQTLKILLLPILLISAALPSAVEFGLSYWYQMAYLSAVPAWFILKHLGLPVGLDLRNPLGPSIDITTSSGNVLSFVVSVASSGIYSLVGATLFFAFLGYIAKGPAWKKIALFLSAYPLLLVVNIMREAILVSAAYFWGESAFNAFHATSGIVLVFILTFILLIIGERTFGLQIVPSKMILKYCSFCADQFRNRSKFCANCGRFLGNSANRLSSKDFLPVVAIALFVMIFFSSLVPTVAVANAPTNTSLRSLNSHNAINFLPQVKGWNLTFSTMDFTLIEALQADAAMDFIYRSLNSSATVSAVVQITSEVHIPQTSLYSHCLLYSIPCATYYVQPEDVQLIDNPPLVGQFMAFQYSALGPFTYALIYWQEPALFNMSMTSGNRITAVYETRTIQVQLLAPMISLNDSGVIKSVTDYRGAENFLLPLAIATAKYWAPQGTVSSLTVGVKRWSGLAIGVSLLPSVILAGRDFVSNFSETKNWLTSNKAKGGTRKSELKRKGVYDSLPPDVRRKLEEMGLLGLFSKTNGSYAFKGEDRSNGAKSTKLLTLEKLVSLYKDRTGNDISFPDAFTAMTYAEHLGLAKKVISDASDEPVLMWKLCAPFAFVGKPSQTQRDVNASNKFAASNLSRNLFRHKDWKRNS
jgi:exosortase/archaeosortase family protein